MTLNAWTTKKDNQVKYHINFDGIIRRFDSYIESKEYIECCLGNMSLKANVSCESKRVG